MAGVLQSHMGTESFLACQVSIAPFGLIGM